VNLAEHPILVLITCGALGFAAWRKINAPHVSRTTTLEPNTAGIPVQREIKAIPPITLDHSPEFIIEPVAEYTISGKVLSSELYSSDRVAQISPVDIALVWGPPSLHPLLKKLDISQWGRFYTYYFPFPDGFPFDVNAFAVNSANSHIIPANDNVKKAAAQTSKGDIIKVDGYLVNVTTQSRDFIWKTSLTRDDRNGGACEIIYAKSIQIGKKIYN